MKKQKKKSDTHLTKTQKLIVQECDYIKELLLEKNRSYGNSCLSDFRVFSKCDKEEAIRVRIDDKLSRILMGTDYNHEDTEQDILGYLILLRISKRLNNGKKKKH